MSLVERLRAYVACDGGDLADVEAAADEIERLTAERDALLADKERLVVTWRPAYLAFKGAFDTPQQRRLMPDEYSQDARTRLRYFDAAIDAARKA